MASHMLSVDFVMRRGSFQPTKGMRSRTDRQCPAANASAFGMRVEIVDLFRHTIGHRYVVRIGPNQVFALCQFDQFISNIGQIGSLVLNQANSFILPGNLFEICCGIIRGTVVDDDEFEPPFGLSQNRVGRLAQIRPRIINRHQDANHVYKSTTRYKPSCERHGTNRRPRSHLGPWSPLP